MDPWGRILAIALLIHGALLTLSGALLTLAGMGGTGSSGLFRQAPMTDIRILGLGVGILQIVAGLRNLRKRERPLATTALLLGLPTGLFYPRGSFGLLLGGFGLAVLFRREIQTYLKLAPQADGPEKNTGESLDGAQPPPAQETEPAPLAPRVALPSEGRAVRPPRMAAPQAQPRQVASPRQPARPAEGRESGSSGPPAALQKNVGMRGGRKEGQKAFWREGQLLFARHGAVLPSRCIKCNNFTTEPPKKSQFYWHPSGWNFLYLLAPAIYRTVAKAVRHQVDVTFAVCPSCYQKRTVLLVVGYLGMIASLIACLPFVSNDKPAGSLLCVLGFFLFFLMTRAANRRLVPVRIDEAIAQLKGCGEGFLASLDRG